MGGPKTWRWRPNLFLVTTLISRISINYLENLMPKTQINCPQCRQPIVADIQQLFDVNENPQAKQIFLSGRFNVAQCPHCGYQGMLTSPLVYHDPEKELLLTYFPPELALPINEQERVIGPLINRVVANLPQEKRKGYLFNPKTMLTLQLMVETVLEGEGITKEMIQAQQERINLIQRLLSAKGDGRIEMIQAEDGMIDDEFFGIYSRLLESALMSGDENAGAQLGKLQEDLLEHSTQGKKLRDEADEIQRAMETIQEMGEDVTREKLMDLILDAPTDTSLRAYVRLVRPAMDYAFFQMLSERVESAKGEKQAHLTEIREKLLGYTQEVDDEIAERRAIAQQNLEAVLQANNLEETLKQNIEAVDEFFLQAVNQALAQARKSGDLEHSARLQQILDVLEKLSEPPSEIALIESLLKVADDAQALKAAVEQNGDAVTPELVEMLIRLVTQTQAGVEQLKGPEKERQEALLAGLQSVHLAVLGFSMRRSFKSG
jgi:hypothetical protein